MPSYFATRRTVTASGAALRPVARPCARDAGIKKAQPRSNLEIVRLLARQGWIAVMALAWLWILGKLLLRVGLADALRIVSVARGGRLARVRAAS